MNQTGKPLSLMLLDKTIVREASTFAGIKTQIIDGDNSHMPKVWDALFQGAGKPGQIGWLSYGVCWSEPGKSNVVNYMAAFEWDPAAAIPAPFEGMRLVAQTYRVFRLTTNGGPLPPQMQAAAKEIWGTRIPEAGWRVAKAPDLEVYAEDFRPNVAGVTVDFLVPVEG